MATKKTESFTGFTPATIQFFNELKENNYKEWFEEHRTVYEKNVLNPLKALVTSLSPSMHNIDSRFELRPHRAVSRIYRDVRFSKNKDPYKTNMWLTFQIPVSRDDWKEYPGYFMEITGDNYTYGMGLFMPKRKVMDEFREEVSFHADEFKRITQETVLDRGFTPMGEEYKRKIENDMDDYLQPWIQRKGIWVAKTLPIGDEVFSEKIAEQMRADFISLEWLYNFLKLGQ